MDIKNRQELAKIITLCRKNGIDFFKDAQSGIELSFGTKPFKAKRKSKLVETEVETPESPQLTPEDRLFWSSPTIPDESVAV